jgi:membrane associated rhomboid family serine protease
MKRRFDPTGGFGVPPKAVIIMIGWLIFCFTGVLGPVANAAHLVGLLVGAPWGFSSSKVREFKECSSKAIYTTIGSAHILGLSPKDISSIPQLSIP